MYNDPELTELDVANMCVVDTLEEKFIDHLDSLQYSNRYLSLAKTTIESACMWARRGIETGSGK